MAVATTATTLMAVVVVIVSMIAVSVQVDNCDAHGNGCSVPFRLPLFYKKTFTHSCNRHDICYGCGTVYGFSRRTCDNAFLQDMNKACQSARGRRLISREKRNTCSAMARNVYYRFVRLFGFAYFKGAGRTETYCRKAWVRACLPRAW